MKTCRIGGCGRSNHISRMARFLMLVFLGLELFVASAQQSDTLEWLPEELYNPQIEPIRCGLHTDEPGFVCDPDKILGEHIQSINWHLKDAAYNSTRCPCSNYFCEHDRTPAKGYHIGLAVVNKMTLQTLVDGRTNSPEDQAQLFAYRLENSRWKLGNCDEDIIIFYSKSDNVLALYGGSTAITKLTPHYRKLLIHKVASRFNDGLIVEALHNLIYDIKKVLNCDSTFQDSCELLALTSGSSIASFNRMVIVTTFLTVVLKFL